MRNIEDIITIIKTEKNNIMINILEEIQIERAAKSADKFNYIINDKNEPFYRLLPPADS
jgi:hypothetical protein